MMHIPHLSLKLYRDADGIQDDYDNCPDVANSDQANADDVGDGESQ